MDHSKNKKENISCKLSDKQLAERAADLKKTIFSKVTQIHELADGYRYTFHEPVDFSSELIAFLNFERKCCPFFSFSLRFEPDEGPVHLQITGPEAAKVMLTSFSAQSGGEGN